MRHIEFSLVVSLLLATACVKEVEQQETPEELDATLAVFAPDSAAPCNSVIPFPNDIARSPATGRVGVPFCDADTASQTDIKRGVRTADGFSMTTPIYVTFSRDIDPATAADAVQMWDLENQAPVPINTMFDPNTKRLYVAPVLMPLQKATRYLVFVTNDLEDADGDAVAADTVFTFAKSREPLTDEQGYSNLSALSDAEAFALEGLRVGIAGAFEFIETAVHVPREDVVVAWVFTTQTVDSSLEALASAAVAAVTVDLQVSVPATEHPLLTALFLPAQLANICDVHAGTITVPNSVNNEGLLDIAGESSTTTIDYILVEPNPTGNCDTSDWNFSRTIVFAHALGRCKNDALALSVSAGAAAAGGWAILSLDGPRAGGRMAENLGDNDLDGCPDQPATPELLALSGSPNPFAVRHQLRQWASELAAAASVAESSPWELVGATAPGAAIDPDVALFGHSWGGIAAVFAGAVSDDVYAVAVNASIADLDAAFEPQVRAAIGAQVQTATGLDPTVDPGLSIVNAQMAEAMPAFRWGLEPADAEFVGDDGDIGKPVLVQVVDSGFTSDAPLHDAAQQAALADVVATSTTTYDMTYDPGGGFVTICDDATAAVGAILQPCVEDTSSPEYAQAFGKLSAMRSALIGFLMANLPL
jgi:hypothetical protein